MATVREAAFELFRERGMTTMFGNPGSTELPMLAEFPDDFRYVLGLQEAVAVGMADGYAQASGQADPRQPPHRARGRQRDGRDLQRPGEQVAAAGHRRPAGRGAQMTMQANLTNRDATRVADPFVKWSYEPPRAEDVPPRSRAAIHLASLPPQGPDVRLAADGRLDRRGRRRRDRATRSRASVSAAAGRRPGAVKRARQAARRGQEPGAGRRPRHRRQRRLGRRGRAGREAEAAGVRVARRPAAGGSASPRATRCSRASCRRRSARSPRRSRAAT